MAYARSYMDHSGAWWSYPVYAAGFVVAKMSPDDLLLTLSIVAVLVRLGIDTPTLVDKYSPKVEKIVNWLKRPFE